MVHSSLHEPEQGGKVGDSGWLEKGELGVVPEVMGRKDIRQVWMTMTEKKREEPMEVVQADNEH